MKYKYIHYVEERCKIKELIEVLYLLFNTIFVSPLLPSVLEVHQFAQEAVVAEAWLTAQEPFISSKELGGSVDEVEQLIRRHEAFRKAAATWEERFSSLRRLTTVILSSSS